MINIRRIVINPNQLPRTNIPNTGENNIPISFAEAIELASRNSPMSQEVFSRQEENTHRI